MWCIGCIYHSSKISSHLLINCSELWEKFLSQAECHMEVFGQVQVVCILNLLPAAIWVQFHACLTMALDVGIGQFLVLVAYSQYPKHRRLGAPWRQSGRIWNLNSSIMQPAMWSLYRFSMWRSIYGNQHFEVSFFILFTSCTTCGTLQKISIKPAILKPNSKRLNNSDKIYCTHNSVPYQQPNKTAVLKILTHFTCSWWCKICSFTHVTSPLSRGT
jgi:hypothetical protein